jgi:hypothetical protein
MAQHDYVIDDGPGVVVRGDFNAVLEAIRTNNSGPVAPAVTFPGMWWLDTSDPLGPGAIKIRSALNDGWQVLPIGLDYLPTSGGNITGDLAVAGRFTNPGFDALRINHAGPPPGPASPLPGMLWYDTSVALMKVRTTTNTWVVAVPTVDPVFSDTLTVSAAAAIGARVDLTSAAEKRSLVSNATDNRLEFRNPANAVAAYITDAGDLVTVASGSIAAALGTKQASLGFTPVRQGGGAGMGANTIYLGWGNPGGHILAQIDATTWGYIYTSADPPPATQALWRRGDLGSVSFLNTLGSSPGVGGDQLIDTTTWYLTYGWDGNHGGEMAQAGSWRNLGGGADGDLNFLMQRQL